MVLMELLSCVKFWIRGVSRESLSSFVKLTWKGLMIMSIGNLSSAMENMGVDLKSITWIKGCLPLAYFFIIINRRANCLFRSSYGFRLGDHVSLLLFKIAMEVFSAMMKKAIEVGWVDGV